jgi:voltage-gated potassium channel
MANRSVPVGHSASRRWRVLRQLEQWLDTPMLVLSFVWLALALLEMTNRTNGLFRWLGTVIWIVFIADFLLRFTLAPNKLRFLRGNWLTLISLLVPALRLFRFARVLHLLGSARGVDLVKIVGSMNRGMNALRKSLGRRRVGYVLVLTVVVTLAGAAGMLQFEAGLPDGQGFTGYADALWWTAMIMTTIGSQYWPVTAEGRILAFLLSIYAISVFGYLTAALATFFVGRDAEEERTGVAGQQAIERLIKTVERLEAELRDARAASPVAPPGAGAEPARRIVGRGAEE